MDVFKKQKKAPIKVFGYDFIGFHKDYENVCYYVRSLAHNNFEILEAKLEKVKNKFTFSAGTTIKVLDSFMYAYLKTICNSKSTKDLDIKEVIKEAIDDSFKDLKEDEKQELINKYSCKVPNEILKHDQYKKAVKEGFSVLYCCNDAINKKNFSSVTIVMVKTHTIDGFHIKRDYTCFRPLSYLTKPSFVKGENKTMQYAEYSLPDLNISHDILNK